MSSWGFRRFTCKSSSVSTAFSYVSICVCSLIRVSCYFQFVFSPLEWIPVAIWQVQRVWFPSSVQYGNMDSISIMNRSRNRDLDTGWTARNRARFHVEVTKFFSSEQRPGPGVNFSRREADHSPTAYV